MIALGLLGVCTSEFENSVVQFRANAAIAKNGRRIARPRVSLRQNLPTNPGIFDQCLSSKSAFSDRSFVVGELAHQVLAACATGPSHEWVSEGLQSLLPFGNSFALMGRDHHVLQI